MTNYKMPITLINIHISVLILCMGAGDVRDMILSAKRQNLLTGEYIFIIVDFKAGKWRLIVS